jgi:hypothetical protein
MVRFILGAIVSVSIISIVYLHTVSSISHHRGEWHTYPDDGLISSTTRHAVIGWYAAAFKTTKLQTRYPFAPAYAAGMGFHDDSFASATLDGVANGNVDVGWFFYPLVKDTGATDFWKRGVMGGETTGSLQETIFDPSYPAGTDGHQDFLLCVNKTHATFMVHFLAFVKGGGYSGTTLVNARRAHARMGYNFQITKVAISSSSAKNVTVQVTVQQTGVAPYYYPLSLVLSCRKTTKKVSGVDGLLNQGDSKVFSFVGIPAKSSCLNAITMTLASSHAHAGRPIKFAQGSNGSVKLRLPLPPSTAKKSVPSPGVASAKISKRPHFLTAILLLFKRSH